MQSWILQNRARAACNASVRLRWTEYEQLIERLKLLTVVVRCRKNNNCCFYSNEQQRLGKAPAPYWCFRTGRAADMQIRLNRFISMCSLFIHMQGDARMNSLEKNGTTEVWLVRVSGHVQGVGYRDACVRRARTLGPLCGVSSMTTEQHEVLTALKVKQPSQFKQLSLL